MKTSTMTLAALLIALTACGSDSGTSPATLTLQNDSYSTGAAVGFQGGFVAGEGVGVLLGPQSKAYSVRKIVFLFGGATTTKTITLRINADNGTDAPGAELRSQDYPVTGSNTGWQEIDLTAAPVSIAAGSKVRIGLIFQHTGLPGVARDEGGITPGRNFIYTSSAWGKAEASSITGDWIIRAEIRTN